MSHAPRARLASRHPVHVTMRAVAGAPNLRRGAAWLAVDAALRGMRARGSCRVVHFSVQTNHVHLLVEAHDAAALSRGMQALAIRIARGVNGAANRRGKLWGDRFHARALRTPREVRNALCYVLQNARRHADLARGIVDPEWIDPRSSGRWLDGWRERGEGALGDGARRDGMDEGCEGAERPVASARTWLLSEGWRRHGLLRVDEVPPAAFRSG